MSHQSPQIKKRRRASKLLRELKRVTPRHRPYVGGFVLTEHRAEVQAEAVKDLLPEPV